MRKSTGFALLSIFFIGLFLRLLPLYGHLYWGADTGEYYFLTKDLIANGSITLPYEGWGFTYPYFPGMIFLNAAVGFTNVSFLLTVSLVAVCLASLSVFPIFLLGRTLFHEDSTSLIAAGIMAVSMPMVYMTSHAVPGAVGDLLFVTCLLLFIKAHFNPKMYYLLYPISLGLIVTHHLSTYFLIIALLASVFFRELISKRSDQSSLRLSIFFLIFLVAASLAYWVTYAEPFRDVILSKVFGTWWPVVAILALAFPVLYALVKLRRRMKWHIRLRYPDLRSRFGFLLMGIVAIYTIMAVNVYVGVPGTNITPSDWAFVYFTPLLMILAFGIAGRAFTDFSRRGSDVTSWFVVIAASLVFATLFANEVLLPYRHMQYMMPPSALLVGIGISRVSGLLGVDTKKKRIVVGTVISSALVLLAATSLPQKDLMDRMSEGIKAEQISSAYFCRQYVDGLVASDHLASAVIFGFGETNATWDTARDSLLADTFDDARAEMQEVNSPSGRKRVDFVAIDNDLEAGAMLFPWDPAPRPSEAAINKFEDSPYMKLYDNGYSRLYYVNWGLA
jgi:hypothetical protein